MNMIVHLTFLFVLILALSGCGQVSQQTNNLQVDSLQQQTVLDDENQLVLRYWD